ncbi:MAG: hypothetical protein IJ057_01090 [Bacteroidales bacterium]|nr:hypothetical protein [Bacteroidales bacterium]
MKTNKIVIAFLVVVVMVTSCKKDHYDVGNVHGINAEGEVLLPVGSKSFTMMDMMERFQIDSLIHCSDDGSLSYHCHYETFGVISGNDLLRFDDLNQQEHFAIENPFGGVQVPFVDTVLGFRHTVVFEADHIQVFEATMKLGRLDFFLSSNVGVLQKVLLSTPNIQDASGHDFMREFEPQNNSFGFDLTGFRYVSDSANALTINFELHCAVSPSSDPELFVDVKIQGTDLAFSEMKGYVEDYRSRNRLDTVFSLFSGNMSGLLEVNDMGFRISERNTFELTAQLEIDSALVTGDGIEPYSLLDPLPLVADLPVQPDFSDVHSQTLNGKIPSGGGRILVSSVFAVNSSRTSEMVTVADTCDLDVMMDVKLPFSFNISEVNYVDTVNLDLAQLDMPDWIERLALDLTFSSTLPLNLKGRFLMYDSDHELITDTLVGTGQLIQASFDGQLTVSTISIEVTEERLEKVLHSDRIIMEYELDTEDRDIKLDASQKLGLFVKARAKYNGIVELEE